MKQHLLFQQLIKSAKSISYAPESLQTQSNNIESLEIYNTSAKLMMSIKDICPYLTTFVSSNITNEVLEEISKIQTLINLNICISELSSSKDSLLKMSELRSLTLYNIDIDANFIKPVLEGLTQLEEIKIGKTKRFDKDFISVLKDFTGLKSFGLIDVKGVTVEVFNFICESMSFLRKFSLVSCDFKEFNGKFMALERMGTIEELVFENCKLFKENDKFVFEFPVLPSLKMMSFKNQPINQEQLRVVSLNCQNINNLLVQKCRITDDKLLTIIQSLPHVSSLSLNSNPTLTPRSIMNLVDYYSNIRCLKLECCKLITDRSVILISQRLKGLNILDLENCQLTNKGLSYLRLLKKLKSICVAGNTRTKSLEVKLIVSLKELEVYWNRSLRKEKILGEYLWKEKVEIKEK